MGILYFQAEVSSRDSQQAEDTAYLAELRSTLVLSERDVLEFEN